MALASNFSGDASRNTQCSRPGLQWLSCCPDAFDDDVTGVHKASHKQERDSRQDAVAPTHLAAAVAKAAHRTSGLSE